MQLRELFTPSSPLTPPATPKVWAICVAQFTGSWGMYGLLNWLPTFFTEYYNVPLADLGGFTLIPYVVQGGLGVVAGVVAGGL